MRIGCHTLSSLNVFGLTAIGVSPVFCCISDICDACYILVSTRQFYCWKR